MNTLATAAAFVIAAIAAPALAQTPTISTFAGTGTPEPTGDGGLATQAGVGYPYQVAADALGNIYFSEEDPGDTRIRRVDENGVITTVVGGGSQPLAHGALADQVLVPGVIEGFAVAPNGDLYFGVFNRIYRVAAQTKELSTYAGGAAPTQFQPILRPNGQPVTVNGVSQLPLQSGDSGPATGAYIDRTGDMLFDAQGDLVFIAGFTVRKVDQAGIISTVAGTPEIRIFLDDPNAQSPGLVTVGGVYSGDGGPAAEAGLGYPTALAINSEGDLFIYDNHIEWQDDPAPHTRIRRVDADTLYIDAYVGSGVPGYSGDGDAALQAQISGGWGLAVDSADHLYISDTDNGVIRRVDALTNAITTIAGTPSVFDFGGDGGPAANASFNYPFDIAFDPAGDLYIADLANARIRRVTGLNPDAPPTADAGPDQSIHAGSLVALDGSASFDDNSPALTYAWSFLSAPAGSTAALTDPAAAATTFTADLQGTYVLELVVEDSLGQASPPDQVVISSTNLAPTADAGPPDQSAAIGNPVLLDGSASSDPELDPLSYQWAIVQAPVGSTAALLSPFTVATAFVPDLAGSYTLELIVSDAFGPSAPDTVLVTAITGEEFAENTAADAIGDITALPPTSVATQGNQQAIVSLLNQVVQSVQSDNLSVAITKLQQAIERTDGCVLRGAPDAAGPGRDWITDCTAQQQLYADLTAALAAITP